MSLCVIPARGGSKRIPKKNIKLFFGRPMISWSISVAIDSNCFDHIIVSTDCEETANIAEREGAEIIFKRPKSLSNDIVGTVPVIAHAIKEAEKVWNTFEYVCCLYATAPFARPGDIINASQLIKKTNVNYSFPITTFPFPVQRGVWIRDDGSIEMFQPEHALTRSQDLKEGYHDAGQFYWGRKEAWVTGRSILASGAHPIIIPRERVQDIDTLEDWEHAELLFSFLNRKN